ncbi:hypothetical protein V1505DRAFT_367788 [Lipomyces doorenjongii]
MERAMHPPFASMSDAMHEGLLRASYALELTRKPKDKNLKQDAEWKRLMLISKLEEKVRYFKEQRRASLKKRCELKGVDFPEDAEGPLERTRSKLQRCEDLTGKQNRHTTQTGKQ